MRAACGAGSHIGGPLALVQNGDLICLDVPSRRLDLLVPEEEVTIRRFNWKKPEIGCTRGYGSLYAERVTQANRGCDFDFLSGRGGVPEPAIH